MLKVLDDSMELYLKSRARVSQADFIIHNAKLRIKHLENEIKDAEKSKRLSEEVIRLIHKRYELSR